MFQPVSVPM
ncbi:hypothetical protein F383_19547 [Gossypium arboreum]|uniref:Uncharacterized protein n=1 Tax=Gossypium arboreum TaxID=29729 RepID=A0A0B0NIM5_GOSAR|nr:hypothetical protein F383_19547 [Gossypium arboreum]